MRNGEDRQLPGGTEIILLVEDNSEARMATKTMLAELGYSVIEALDGDDALNKFRADKQRIHLVMLDVIMPNGSIKPIYDEMRLIRPDTKAIFFSGYTEEILKGSGMIEEGLNFLTKPFLSAQLARKVREVLDT